MGAPRSLQGPRNLTAPKARGQGLRLSSCWSCPREAGPSPSCPSAQGALRSFPPMPWAQATSSGFPQWHPLLSAAHRFRGPAHSLSLSLSTALQTMSHVGRSLPQDLSDCPCGVLWPQAGHRRSGRDPLHWLGKSPSPVRGGQGLRGTKRCRESRNRGHGRLLGKKIPQEGGNSVSPRGEVTSTW